MSTTDTALKAAFRTAKADRRASAARRIFGQPPPMSLEQATTAMETADLLQSRVIAAMALARSDTDSRPGWTALVESFLDTQAAARRRRHRSQHELAAPEQEEERDGAESPAK